MDSDASKVDSAASKTALEDPRVERSRRVVRRAVLEELADVGYGALTIEAVARRAGVGKSTIYRHWPGRAELIADAFEHAHQERVPDVESISLFERVVRLVGHVAEVVVDPLFSRCIPALIEGAERDEVLRAFHYRYSDTRRRELAAVIAGGVEAGEFDSAVDAEAAAVALLGVIFYRRLMTPEPVLPAHAEAIVATLIPLSEYRPAR
jgi:TetR/AcrR family transcriptional regulator, regulator of autoinduction and epiphytic fitness